MAGVIVAATLLRLLLLPREALGGDEVFSHLVSIGPLAPDIRDLRRDIVHPPLYYFALRGAVALIGDSPAALRALSLAVGAGLLLLAAGWTRGLTGQWRWGLLAALLLALSPLQLRYSEEARGYALYAFLVVGAAMLLGRALRRPGATGAWAGFSLAALGAVLTHYVAAIYVACTLPAVLLSPEPRKALPRWSLAVTAPVVGLIGWLALVWPYYRGSGGLDAELAWISAPTGYHLVALYAEYSGLPGFRRGTTLAVLVTAVVAILALAATWGDRRAVGARPATGGAGEGGVARWDRALLAALALLPPVGVFLLTLPPLSLPIWGTRHLLPSQAFWIVGLVLLIHGAARQRPRLALALAGGLAALQALALGHALRHPFRVPYHEIAGYVRRHGGPDVPMLTLAPHTVGLPVTYYLPDREAVDSFRGVARSPASFWLLYRPVVDSERVRLDSLVDGGWRVLRRAHFGPEWGTTAALLARPGPGGASAVVRAGVTGPAPARRGTGRPPPPRRDR